MKTSDFDYTLPLDRIAQRPLEPRHSSRLMVLNRVQKGLEHSTFWDLPIFLKPGDLVVINQTRVIPARIYAHKPTGGKVELLLLNKRTDTIWEVLVGGKKMLAGSQLEVIGGPKAVIDTVLDGSRRLVRFKSPVDDLLGAIGEMPLPPYIHEHLDDPESYQTIYANTSGSAAAPTAGLHFTPELISRLEQLGINFARVTLHVGLDTFAPVTEVDPHNHQIHTEWCELDEVAANKINSTRKEGGRIIAVGTTSVRTLESAATCAVPGETVSPLCGATDLFILPGYQFKAVDAMITNFHLPKSTLLMLVSAFAGREAVLDAYDVAIRGGYRFYSFGDAMLIL